MNVYYEVLGCWKNTVDTENIATILANNNFNFVDSIEEADIIIINTCGFIVSAQNESIKAISYFNDLKENNPSLIIIVYGCLNSVKINYLKKNFRNVDVFFKVSERDEFISSCLSILPKKKRKRKKKKQKMIMFTPLHLKMLKISEGCSNKCSYCLIPKIRGSMISKDIHILKDDFAMINTYEFIKEVILLGQDTANYGSDKKIKGGLALLVKNALDIIKRKDFWLRVMYMHPKHFDFEFLNIMKNDLRLVRYLDIPLQHTEDNVLNAMNRGYNKKFIYELFNKIKSLIPDITIRTTVIVGHPEEKKRDFDNMVEFLNELQFDYIGVFDYSKEKKTPDYLKYKSIKVKRENKSKKNIIFSLQKKKKQNNTIIGKDFKTLIDAVDAHSSYGRTGFMAPDIDDYVKINDNSLKPGGFYNIKLLNYDEDNFCYTGKLKENIIETT